MSKRLSLRQLTVVFIAVFLVAALLIFLGVLSGFFWAWVPLLAVGIAASLGFEARRPVYDSVHIDSAPMPALPSFRAVLLRVLLLTGSVSLVSFAALSWSSTPPDYVGVCVQEGMRLPDVQCIGVPVSEQGPRWVYYPFGAEVPLAGFAATGYLDAPPKGSSFVNGHVDDGVDRSPSDCGGLWSWRC